MLPFLKFPPVFGGNYSDPTTWVVLAVIIALVIGVGFTVTKLLGGEGDFDA